MPAYISPGKLVSKPAPGRTDDIDVRRCKSQFLAKFAVKRVHGGFVTFDAALGKLPRILPDPPRPQDLVLLVGEDYADVGSESVRINHV